MNNILTAYLPKSTPRMETHSSFGVAMAERSWIGDYRYGFNGKEKDDEGTGGGLSTYDYGFRIYNPALGKFLSVDPLIRTYVNLGSYQFAGNSPIKFIDLDGQEMFVTGTASDRFINLLAARTGLSLTKDVNGMLNYAKTKVPDDLGGEKEAPLIDKKTSGFVSDKLRTELIRIIDRDGRKPVEIIAKTQDEIKSELGNDNVLIDSFSEPGSLAHDWVDMDDLDNMGSDPGMDVVQTALVGHIIRERGSLNPSGLFVDAHDGAMLFERDIIGEKFPGENLHARGDDHGDKLDKPGGLLDPEYSGKPLDSYGLKGYATGLNLDYGTAQFITISPVVSDDKNQQSVSVNEIVGCLGGKTD